MWEYHERTETAAGGKPLALYRTKGHIIERYEGAGRWTDTFPWSGRINMDISGMGGSWALYSIVQPKKVAQVMALLFPDDPEPDDKGV